MKNRLPTVLAVTALVVALLGSTGIAQAVVVGFAANAGKLAGFKASKKAKKNTVVVRGQNGKIDAASIPAQARGARGATGAPGATGPPGAQGIQGTQGIQGLKGDKGDQGVQGLQGTQGLKGDKGDKGDRGPSFGDAKYVSSVPIASCGGDSTSVTYPVTLTEPSRIFASATASYTRTDPGAQNPSVWIRLMSGGTTVASTNRRIDFDVPGNNDVILATAGVLRSTSSGLTGFTIPAGTYTLVLAMTNFGLCAGTGTYRDIELSHILLGAA